MCSPILSCSFKKNQGNTFMEIRIVVVAHDFHECLWFGYLPDCNYMIKNDKKAITMHDVHKKPR